MTVDPASFVTVHLLYYPSVASRFWAFSQMGLMPGALAQHSGASFIRLMGSGSGEGFSIWPDFSRYALLAAWPSEAAAQQFFAHDDWWQQVCQRTTERLAVTLEPVLAHGQWDGQMPFAVRGDYDPTQPIAVLTRATIRKRKLPQFWRYVPSVSASIYQHPARRLSIGIGEYPLFMQATFSVWESGRAMQEYAYRSAHHREVIHQTRAQNWYREELFARFRVLRLTGQWRGQTFVAAPTEAHPPTR